jgi:hypothetical protein
MDNFFFGENDVMSGGHHFVLHYGDQIGKNEIKRDMFIWDTEKSRRIFVDEPQGTGLLE